MIHLSADPSALVSFVARLLKGQRVQGGTDPADRESRPVVVKITEPEGLRLARGVVAGMLSAYEKGTGG